MAVYACGYPIYHEFTNPGEGNTITYSVQIDSVEYNNPIVYTGMLHPSGSDSVIKVDLSPIFRNYLEMLYEDSPIKDIISPSSAAAATFYAGRSGLTGSVNTFTVIPADNPGSSNISYTVVYDYNTDYQSTLPGDGTSIPNYRNTNIPLSFEADPRQFLFVTELYVISRRAKRCILLSV